MADLGISGLKTEVDVQIYTNHAQAITGAIMNDTLIDTIDTLKNGGNLDAKSVDTAQLADNAVEALQIASGAVTESKIASGAVTEAKIGAKAVTNAKIGDKAVDTLQIADGAVEALQINTNAVETAKIKDLAVTADKIATGAITHAKIGIDAIDDSNIQDGSITELKIYEGSINEGHLQMNCVTEEKIASGAVIEDKIAASAVTNTKIASAAVETAKIKDLNVTTSKLAAKAVTSEKLADDSMVRTFAGAVLLNPYSASLTPRRVGDMAINTTSGEIWQSKSVVNAAASWNRISAGFYNGSHITDWNAINLSGDLTSDGTATGAPKANESFYGHHTNSNAGTANAYQIAIGYTTGKIYQRSKVNSTWGAWSMGVTATELGYLSGVTSNIQEQLNSKLDISTVNLINNLAVGYGIKPVNGNVAGSATYSSTDYIPVNGSDIISNCYIGNPYWGGAVYDINKIFIRRLESTQYTYISGDYYIRLTFRETNQEKRANYGTTLLPYEAYDPIKGYKSELAKLTDILPKGYYRKYEDITAKCTYHNGRCSLSGDIYPTDASYRWTRISVNEGDVFDNHAPYGSQYRFVCAFNGNTAIAEKGAEDVASYTVPSGITDIIITKYAAHTETASLIVANHLVYENNEVNNLQKQSHTYSIRKPRVTIIDDDGNIEFYQYLLPMMKAHGIPMVSSYMGDTNPDMSSNAALMTAAQCKEVVSAGGEIIVHYNQAIHNIPIADAERIVLQNKQILADHGFDSRLLVYSNNTCNPEVREMVSKYFDAAFTGSYPRVSNTERSNKDCIVQYAIHRENAGGVYYNDVSCTLQYFKDLVDECVALNGWLVLVTHSFLMPEGKRIAPWESVDQLGILEDTIEYIKSLESTTGIKIVTATDGLDMFGNVWQSGDYLGYWNEMVLDAGQALQLGRHDSPGCAMNKEGRFDMPTSNKIIH